MLSQAPVPSALNVFFLSFLLRSASYQYRKDHLPSSPSQTNGSPSPSSNADHRPPNTPKAAIIIQLTGLVEKGVHKADAYLPRKVGMKIDYPPLDVLSAHHPTLSLTLDSIKSLPELSTSYSMGTLSCPSFTPTANDTTKNKTTPSSSDSEGTICPIFEKELRTPMELHHYAYSGWPDWGVPSGKDTPGLVELVRLVGREQKRLGCEVWVHW